MISSCLRKCSRLTFPYQMSTLTVCFNACLFGSKWKFQNRVLITFYICSLPIDVKDLLRRLLAPDSTRASLDLIIFHPWLKPYQIIPKEKTPPDSPLMSEPVASPASPRQLVAKRTSTPVTVKDTRDALMEAIADKRLKYASSNTVSSSRQGKALETKASPLQKEIMLEDSPNTSVRSRLSVPADRDGLQNRMSMSMDSSEVTAGQDAEGKNKKRNRKSLVLLGKALADAFSFIMDGPYAPPRKPYEQLVHLGRNQEEQALYLQDQQVRRSWRSYDSPALSVR